MSLPPVLLSLNYTENILPGFLLFFFFCCYSSNDTAYFLRRGGTLHILLSNQYCEPGKAESSVNTADP